MCRSNGEARDSDPRNLVRAGYDAIAEHYLASKDPHDPVILDELEGLAGLLQPGGRVLDLGCGAGVPSTRRLAERFAVTGVDLSWRQLELARRHVPAATFVQADMAAIDFTPGAFDAVTAFYSIIHVPREEHAPLVRRIRAWLKPGGLFLANWPTTAWEGMEENWEGWGAGMWWSHYDTPTNLAMLGSAGFDMLTTRQRTSHGETWTWVLARRGPER